MRSAAEMMSEVAENQATAVNETREAAAESWREAGALYYSLDTEKAVHAYQSADQLDPDNPATLDVLGFALTRAGRFDEAEAALQRCLDSSPSFDQQAAVHINLGTIDKQRGQYEAATAHFRQGLEVAEAHGLKQKISHALQALAREHGLGELQPAITFNRGEMAIQQGDEAAACRHWGAAQPKLVEMRSVYLQAAESRLAEFRCDRP